MYYPGNLKYTRSHEWVKEEGNTVWIGITDYAQNALGDLVFVNLPEEGDSLEIGEAFADVESVKAVSDIYSPVTGAVAEINQELLENPEKINVDPYGTWLIKAAEVTDSEEYMDAQEYQEFAESEE